jgi:hypothetical protein
LYVDQYSGEKFVDEEPAVWKIYFFYSKEKWSEYIWDDGMLRTEVALDIYWDLQDPVLGWMEMDAWYQGSYFFDWKLTNYSLHSFGYASIGGSKSVLPSVLQLASNKHSATTGYHIWRDNFQFTCSL